MMRDKIIKYILFAFSAMLIATVTFFTLEFIFPKAHSDIKSTTTQFISSTNVINIAEKTTETTTKNKTTTEKPTETKPKTTKPSTTKALSTVSSSTVKPSVQPSTSMIVSDDFSILDNCVFIGNSRVIALKNYGLVKNAYAVVGLTVDTIFSKSVAGSTIPVIDELWGKDYEKVFIMLGDNECGWGNKDIFINRYSKVIDAVKERIPDAEIYLQSILPVSKKASDSSPFGVTNENITLLNSKIEKLASDYGIRYLDPASALKNSDGVLPDEAASDGIHLNKKYCKIWLTYIIDNVFSEVSE